MAAAKTGRNEPCPCGSGKKYNKCCLPKDEAAKLQALRLQAAAPRASAAALPVVTSPPRPPRPAPTPLPEPTPEERWWDDLASRLEATSVLDEQISLAGAALAEGPPTDGETLLEIFDLVLDPLQNAGRHAERIGMIEAIEARFPEPFLEQAHYFARRRFVSAIECPDMDLVAEARRFGPHVEKVIDLVGDLPAHLAWEGKVRALRELTTSAWPTIRDSSELLGGAIDEWAAYGISAILLDRLEHTPDLTAEDPELLSDLASFEVETEPADVRAFVRRWIAWLAPRGDLRVDASALADLGRKEDSAALERVSDLVAAVAAGLRKRDGWSLGRSWIIVRELGPLLSACAEAQRTKNKKLPLGAILLPPASTLHGTLLRRNATFFSQDLFVIAAVVHGLPAWAEEIAARGWVSDKQARDWVHQVMGQVRAWLGEAPDAAVGEVGRSLLEFAKRE